VPGKVYLLGAGPGDPELLTLKGRRVLAEADIVVYDRLANPALLDFCRADAELLYGGKSAQEHSLTQAEINALLVERARQGRVVCRLKGGDPFLFGRGGEEAEALNAAGIPWEYVPGVTSAIAVPGYAGIPITHREISSAVTMITAHEDPQRPGSRIRWDTLTRQGETLVFLMGLERLAGVVERLVRHGLPLETPAAVISAGTHPHQQTVTGTLADIVGRAEAAGMRPPALAVVGEVVRLRERLRWFDNRPLFGKRLAVTRPREQAGDISRLIAQQGGEPVLTPTIRIVPLCPPDLTALNHPYDWVVFTSVNGVYSLSKALLAAGRDVRALGSSRIAAIGSETARAVEGAGLRVDFVPSRFVAEQVVEEFPDPVAGLRVLIPRAAEARSLLPDLWREQGARVDVLALYETVADEEGLEELRRRLETSTIDAILFTASSTVRHCVERLGAERLRAVPIACIGPITAGTAHDLGLRADVVAEQFTAAGLVAAVSRHFETG
jgi:uroporphyrinogen III methyltransferase / synthase